MPGAVKTIRTSLVTIACVAVAGGCFWRSYPARTRTHVELLVAFARKGSDLVATGRFTAENLPELTYPLERATAFAADARQRAPEPPASLVALEALLARYRAFVDAADEARRTRGPDAAAPLADALAQVETAASQVEAALERERSGPSG